MGADDGTGISFSFKANDGILHSGRPARKSSQRGNAGGIADRQDEGDERVVRFT